MTYRCSRPWGTRCIVQTDGLIGGLAQPTAQGASELAQTLGVPHLTVMDTVLGSLAPDLTCYPSPPLNPASTLRLLGIVLLLS